MKAVFTAVMESYSGSTMADLDDTLDPNIDDFEAEISSPAPSSSEPLDVLGQLDQTAANARRCLGELEESFEGIRNDQDLKKQLSFYLTRLYTQLIVALDHRGLHSSRAALDGFWKSFQTSGYEDLIYYPSEGVVGSRFFDHLDAILDTIRALGNSGSSLPDMLEQQELQRLEIFLRQIPGIVRQRQMLPDRERSIKQLAEEFLREFYCGDYCHDFDIPGVVKNFRPDSAIRFLKTVIEYKFVDSEEQFKTAASGLFEDSVGYKGSSDWKRYISLIYQTNAYGTEHLLIAEFKQKGLIDWKPIVVTGPGSRTRAS